MIRSFWLRGASATAIAAGVLMAGSAYAQDTEVEEVVVTGSFIAGTPEDTALPVDVTTALELQKQGSPTVVQLVKALPAAAGSIGESNRFLGNAAGSATVNLRGFGSSRTLVLMNGRRMATSPAGIATAGAVDINKIPTAAVGRIEVLKGGAAATYGSDAVGGVVNFITRKDLDGFEVNAEYSYIDGSDGDYNAHIAWGHRAKRGDILLTAGYRRRSELRTTDRDWALQPFARNSLGGWSGASNPGAYQTFAVGTPTGAVALGGGLFAQPPASVANPNRAITLTTFNDPGCTNLGGELSPAGTGQCLFQFSRFDNLVNDEFHYQLYGEVNYEVTDDIDFHAEAFWSRADAPHERVSPSQSTAQFPTPIVASGGSPGGGTSPFPALGAQEQSRFYIPFANPGLTALYAQQCPVGVVSAFCTNAVNGVVTNQTQWRPRGYGGNPLFPGFDGADIQSRSNDSWRISAGLKGKLSDSINFDTAVTYMESTSTIETPDLVVNRLQLALRGLGGAGCNPTTGTPGVGPCQWFNPFSNGIQTDAVYGRANPLYNAAAVPANTNTVALYDWMHEYLRSESTNTILVADAVLSGALPFAFPGGEPQWAAGVQWRYDESSTTPLDPLTNRDAARCVDDADDRSPSCIVANGPFDFYAGIQPSSVDRTVTAVFGELRLPFLDNLEGSLAIRHERFGGNVGETTNPKFDLKWQALDWLAFRGSVGTTFRAPAQESVTPGFARVLSLIPDASVPGLSVYRPVDTFSNVNLEPETAKTYSVGMIVEAGPFNATLDYWRFKFEDELTNETGTSIVSTLFPSAVQSTWRCGEAALRDRITFGVGNGFVNTANPATPNCHPSNILAVRSNLINGPDVDTSGVDFQASYAFPDLGGGSLLVGVEGSYMIEYKRGALITLEGVQIAAALDRANRAELISAFYSYPKVKANLFANFTMGAHNVRATVRYVAPMDDQNRDAQPTVAGLQPGKIGGYVQLDLVYKVELPWETTLTAQVQNLFDEDPSFASSQYNYDYTLANPLGRVIGVGVRKRF